MARVEPDRLVMEPPERDRQGCSRGRGRSDNRVVESGRPGRGLHRGASMATSFTGKKRIRKSFGRVAEVAPMPNLIEVQKSSYDHFLQMDVPPESRGSVGLQEVFKSVFPIRDFSDRARLEFVRYELEQPK